MARKSIYIPDNRVKVAWRGWEKLAERITPENPAGYVMSPSALITLIGEAAMADPIRVARLVGAIIGADE